MKKSCPEQGEARTRHAFRATGLAPERFFVEILKALRHDGRDAMADALQFKSIFLDLGTLNGFTTFIVWMACPDTYELLTETAGGLQMANAASKAAKALGMEKPVGTVIAYYGVKIFGGIH